MYIPKTITDYTSGELEEHINAIPVGKENAITGFELRQTLEISDRKLRYLISLARRDCCIINNQKGKGYYKPESRAEVERWLKQENARAKSILWSTKGAREYLKGTME